MFATLTAWIAAALCLVAPSGVAALAAHRRWRDAAGAAVAVLLFLGLAPYPDAVRALLVIGLAAAAVTYSHASTSRGRRELRARAQAGEIRRAGFEIRVPGGTKEGMALGRVWEDIALICESSAKERRAGFGQVDVEFFADYTRPGMERPEISVILRCDREDEDLLQEAIKLAYHDQVAIHPLRLNEDRSRELSKLLTSSGAIEPEFASARG